MGLDELIRTLRNNEQKQKDAIWQAAKAEADNLRREIAAALKAVIKGYDEQLATACQKSTGSILSEVADKTRDKKLIAYQSLAQALRNTAARQLPQLRENNYKNVFAMLVAELPVRQWEKIVVNPADHELAAKFFSPAIIHPDPAICGGLIAAAESGRITVDNTFEKRLARKWPFLLPTLIAKIEERYGNARPAEKSA